MADTQIQNTEAPVITNNKEDAVDAIEKAEEVAAKLVASEESEDPEKVDVSSESKGASSEPPATETQQDSSDTPGTEKQKGSTDTILDEKVNEDITDKPSEESAAEVKESVAVPEVLTDEGGTEVKVEDVDGDTNKRKVEEIAKEPSDSEEKAAESSEPFEKKPKLDEESGEKATETSD